MSFETFKMTKNVNINSLTNSSQSQISEFPDKLKTFPNVTFWDSGRSWAGGRDAVTAMIAWLTQSTYPFGNFADIPSWTLLIEHTWAHWAHLRGTALWITRCAVPAKLPTRLCLAHRSTRNAYKLSIPTSLFCKIQSNEIMKWHQQ